MRNMGVHHYSFMACDVHSFIIYDMIFGEEYGFKWSRREMGRHSKKIDQYKKIPLKIKVRLKFLVVAE